MKKDSNSPGNEDCHYSGDYQPIDFADEFLAPYFHVGNVIKYIVRHEKKGGKLDLEKALWYLNRLCNIVEPKSVYGSLCIHKMRIDNYTLEHIVRETVMGYYSSAYVLLKEYIKSNTGDENDKKRKN
jgi:hypothetical protein